MITRQSGQVNDMQENGTVQVVTSIAPVGEPVATAAGRKKLTLAEVRTKLDGKTGKRFWKNLDELAETPEFQEMMHEEFPRQAGSGEWVDSVSRRGFMKVMGASFALAGLAGCTKQPDEPIYPYIKQPEDLVLGKPMYFATAHPFPTGAIPVLVKSDAFRPIKLEGNPEHPSNKGKLDTITQATLLDLYDPDRSQHVMYRGNSSSWADFQEQFAANLAASRDGSGVYFLSELITSPTVASQWKAVQAKYPAAKLVQYEPVGGSARAANAALLGEDLDVQYNLADADVILSLDADFLSGISFPGFLPMAAAYGERHRYAEGKTMNRMYVVETMPSVTGFKAEHRLALKPSDIDAFANALVSGTAPSGAGNPETQTFFNALVADLKKSGGRAVVIAGPQSSAACHAAAHAMNAQLGAVGKTVSYVPSLASIPATPGLDLKALVGAMNAGQVKTLVVLGLNPFYNAPVDLYFEQAFSQVPVTVHLGMHRDETGFNATWHVPKAHYLESWGDARANDGTVTIIQPMIEPLYGGKGVGDIFQALLDPSVSMHDAVAANAKSYLGSGNGGGDFAAGWRKALHDGWIPNTTLAAKTPGSANAGAVAGMAAPAGGVEISFKADNGVYDGRYANNGWLQETPRQITNLSWDNAALMSLATMEKLKLEENDAVELSVEGHTVIAPVLMVPGHADDAVTVHLGQGRRAEAGRSAAGVGFNAYAIRTSDHPLSAANLEIKKTGGTYDICVTKVHNIEHRGAYAQRDLERPLSDGSWKPESAVNALGTPHTAPEGTYSLAGHEALERSIIRYATVEEVEKNPDFAHEGASGTLVDKVGYNPQGESPKNEESFYPDAWRYDHEDPSMRMVQNKWGMSIDLNSCIGCNSCVTACYAENNIAVVGREQVKIGRIMQWMRIDTYFEGDLHAPKAHMQPMLCQHCESAGCEQVCPVGATVHTPEGINTMVYNRCVGTRYCSNNCVYKVRRFNFLLYSDYETESLKFMRNPDVTVRSRGVMEKCSYCLQRIQEAKIESDKTNRAIKDGEILTACQQTCPTDAIVFGNMNDPNSRVAKRKKMERDYEVLADLNYRPRTTYTAGVINPNPELA